MEEIVSINHNYDDNYLYHVHISDIHFGKIDPQIQYNILKDQFINKLAEMQRIDIIAIDGDIFDSRYMTSSPPVMYALMFMSDVVNIAISKNAAVVLLHGTWSHDADQLKIFSQYMYRDDIEFHIVNYPKFEYIKGRKILCLPDCAGVSEELYNKLFYYSGYYDAAFFHGTAQGASNAGSNCHLFTEQNFINCCGPIIGGHIHTGGNYLNHLYYNGSPFPMAYGEEEMKGFLIVIQNLKTCEYMVYKEPIISFKYITIILDDMVLRDPREIVNYIDNYKESNNIDHLRVIFNKDIPVDTRAVLNNVYRSAKRCVDIEFRYTEQTKAKMYQEELSKQDEAIKQYDYLFGNSTSEYSKLAKYVNDREGYEFTTVEQLEDFCINKLKFVAK